jgi:PAS domain S-box-containing protein
MTGVQPTYEELLARVAQLERQQGQPRAAAEVGQPSREPRDALPAPSLREGSTGQPLDLGERPRLATVHAVRERAAEPVGHQQADQFMAVRLRLLEFAAEHALEDLLQRTVDEAEHLTGSLVGFYHFVEPDQKTLSLQAWSSRTVSHFCTAEGKGHHYGVDQAGVWADCVRTRRPIIHNDYAGLGHKKGLPPGHAPVLRELVVPILRKDAIVAILGVGNKATPYTEQDVAGVAYLADVAWEVTQRKRAEDAVRESRAKLDLALRSAQMGAWQWDITVDRRRFDDQVCRVLGLDPAIFAGTTAEFFGAVHPDDREKLRALAGRVMNEGASYAPEYRAVWPDGSVHHVCARGALTRDEAGRPLRIDGIIWDNSERKRADEETALLKQSVDDHSDGAYWTDSDGRLIYVNEAACTALGYERAELLGATIDVINPSGTAERMKGVWDTLRRDGAYRSEAVHQRKDGSTFPVEVATTYVRFAGREYACGFARDISERKRAEVEKAALAAQLLQAQKMESVGRLAGGVAHDFNNMLCIIRNNVEFALQQVEPAHPLRGDLEEILAATKRSTDLARQLLAFARKQAVAPRVLALNEVVEGLMRMLGRLIGEDLALSWSPGVNLWPVHMDPAQIDQVLVNLCVNARDAIADVGRIAIETGNRAVDAEECVRHPGLVPGDYACLTVSDDGCGMDPETAAHVFEPFFTTKGVGKGTGLGLATVYGIVKQNDGYIELRTAPGQGAAFSLYLPRHRGAAATAQATAAGESLRGHETILLVEDERAILRAVARMLERQGYTVLTAATPGQALRLASEHAGEIHLLMTDVIMPEMNGRDLARSLLASRPRTRRLFMSGYTADVMAHRGVLDEGISFIQKPFSLEEVTTRVRQVLEGPQGGAARS